MKLKSKINLITFILLVLIFSGLSTFVYQYQKFNFIKTTDQEMESHLEDLHTILSGHVEQKQEMVNIALNLAHNIFYTSGDLIQSKEKITIKGINQITKEEKNYIIPQWEINNTSLYKNYTIVDLIKSKSVESSTIFQKIEDGYIRISTNVMKLDNTRAVSTYIPNSSAVIKTVEKGETFYGRAFVVNDWYLTAYEPIYINGSVQGILYVGIKEKNYNFLKSVFSNKKYYEDGYPFIVGRDGVLLIHPSLEGQNFSNTNFFKQLINAKEADFKSRYQWPETKDGRWKYQYFKYFKPYDSYICVSIYEDDLYRYVNNFLIIIIISAFISIIIFLVVFTIFLNPTIKAILKAKEFASFISKGDLSKIISINQNDEIGSLVEELNSMQTNLKSIITSVIDGADSILTSSHEIHKSSMDVSNGATFQASSVEEISSTLEEFGSNIQQNEYNSRETEDIAKLAAIGVVKGQDSTVLFINAMRSITEKITIINEIANQTNILAINAAIEAARAGDVGLGFAVVSAEVHKLANRSKNAAVEIEELSKKGVLLSEIASNELKEIVPQMKKTSTLVNQVSSASIEMNIGVKQINEAVNNLSQITQSNAGSSEGLVHYAKDLETQAEILKDLVNYFSF